MSKEEKAHTILEAIKTHNEKIKALVELLEKQERPARKRTRIGFKPDEL
ncbi:hypothetical protein [Pedobacter sp. GR22-6]